MAAKPSAGDTDWGTTLNAYLAVEHDADGTHSMIDGDVTTLNDSEANAMLKAHAYLSQTSGFANATTGGSAVLIGFLGTTDDPAGVGQEMGRNHGITAGDAGVGFFVPNGAYFEFTTTDAPTIIWTPLISGGGAPIDQD